MAVFRSPTQEWEKLRKAAADARLPFDKDTWLNLAFYLNEQYVEWNASDRNLRVVPREEGFENVPRPVANKIMHFVAQEHAMALQTRPTIDVLPATDDPVDSSDASVGLSYLRWLTDQNVADLDGELSDATLWALVGGEGWLKWTYNDKLERGDICSCSPLDVYLDPYCKRARNARYIIHSQFLDTEQVYDIFGKEVKPTSIEKIDALKVGLLRDMGAAPVLQGATVNELWMKPNRRQPEGLYVVWSGNTVLVEPQKFPYAHGHLPFTQIGSIPRPGTSHYTCAVKYLRDPQVELNAFHAQMIMIRKTFANPKWYIDAALELEEDPDDSPNQVLRGNGGSPGLKPELIQGTNMPGGKEQGDFIVEEMMNTVGLHEVSQAQVPGRVESSKAIEMLKESDNSRLAELTRTTRGALAEGGWQQLQLAKQFVPDDKILQTYSREGLPEVKRFKKDAIKEGMRVQITMGTGLAKSRAAREEQVWKMIEAGIIRDSEIASELLDIPVGTLNPSKAYDIRKARNENLVLASGQAVMPNSWDDHEIHLREHNNWRKTGEYLSSSKDVKQKFEHHCDTHEQQLVEALQMAAEKQALLAGAMGPPQGAGGGGPAQPQQQPQQPPEPGEEA